jgi:hypothetical protein
LRRFKTGSKRRGKKEAQCFEQEHLPWALSGFSGYIAVDELYDGPFCVISIVDNRRFQRIMCEVLNRDPTHADVERLFLRFKAALDQRGLSLQGVTTDGSPLYPVPLAKVFGPVEHQLCEFHVLKELTRAILHALSKVRRRLKQDLPKLPRGRPASRAARRRVRAKKRQEQKIADLFERRHLFVQHHLTPAERATLQRITRGFPELRRLREIMDAVYRLFDRRCRTHTALEKLRRLRLRVQRFKRLGKTLQKLFSPNLEKALTYLDDSLLPSTSNAVERSNRRHRKMQKSVYRVRTLQALKGRIALDLFRERHRETRMSTIFTLHRARAG